MPKINYTARAEKDLAKIDQLNRRRLKSAIEDLAMGRSLYFPLSGRWKGFFKLRSGNYRIIFEKDSPDSILIRYIRHRREVYR